MTSERDHAFVWIWLPGASDPVVAGRIDATGETIAFTYGRSYLDRKDAIPLYLPELPLAPGTIYPEGREIAGCIADAGPDSWGRRVLENKWSGDSSKRGELGTLDYLLESGSDRIGALDFQASSDHYVARTHDQATLEDLAESAQRVESGLPLTPALDAALLQGSSVGGARPKALISRGERRMIAKFSSNTDTFAVVKGEFVAMELARRAGICVANVELASALDKDVLLVDRFDRGTNGQRRAMVSALTILGLDDIAGRYASYADLAEEIRKRFNDPLDTLRELFARITFNILVGNTDDHARNHAAFWDGVELSLTPAFDVGPQRRSGGEAQQIMAIGTDGTRWSRVVDCVEWSHVYGIFSKRNAREIIDGQIEVIKSEWLEVCELGRLTQVERLSFWEVQFLNPYALQGY